MIVGMVLNWLRHIPAALCDSLGEPHREESSYEPALPTRSIFLGNYAPISFEAEAFDLPLHGELPKELAGTLYRNGPNPRFAPRGPNHHWFIGDGMIHAFHVSDGRVSYRNRWVRTPKWELEHNAHWALFGSWGNPATTDPSVQGKDSGVANTNIVWHGGKLFALEEGHRPFSLDPTTLTAKGYWDFQGAFTGARFTAHPKVDPETGEMIFFAYSANAIFGLVRLWGHGQIRQTHAIRPVRCSLRQHGSRLHGDAELRAISRPTSDGKHAASTLRQAGLRVGGR
jgi:carotenoid cleavage dioxygenase-like enzyme